MYDLDTLADFLWDARGIACDHAYGFAALNHMLQDLMADVPGGSGDDDHDKFPFVAFSRFSFVATGSFTANTNLGLPGSLPTFCDRGKRDDFGRKVELTLRGQFEGLPDAFKELEQRNRLETTTHDLDGRGA